MKTVILILASFVVFDCCLAMTIEKGKQKNFFIIRKENVWCELLLIYLIFSFIFTLELHHLKHNCPHYTLSRFLMA